MKEIKSKIEHKKAEAIGDRSIEGLEKKS